MSPYGGATQKSVDCESLTPTRGATQKSVDSKIVPVSPIAPEGWGPKEGGNATSPLHSRGCPTQGTKSEVKTYARGHHDAPRISKYGSLTPTRGAMQQRVDCESLTPTRGATQKSVDCESLTPTRGATEQSVDSKIVPVSSTAREGWGPKVGGNATSPLHSRGSPTQGTKSEVKTYARGHHDAPSISKYGSLTPTRGATQQSVDSKIVPVSSIAPEGWGPKEGGNATSPLHSRGSPTKGTKSEVKTYARGCFTYAAWSFYVITVGER